MKNYRGVILDLIFTSSPDTKVSIADDEIIPHDMNHHPPLSFVINFQKTCANLNSSSSSYNFRKCDTNSVFAWLQSLSYPSVSQVEAEQHFVTFCNSLAEVVKINCPVKTVRRSAFPAWFGSELERLVIQKKIMHKRFKTTGEIFFYEEFKLLRRQCKILAADSYYRYTEFLESSIPNNIKVFWSHINNLKTSTSPSCLKYNGIEAEDPVSQCERFADFFSSVYTNLSFPSSTFDLDTNCNLYSLTLSAQEVEAKLNTLDPNKGMGPDLIPPAVVKYCSPVLAPILAVYFNLLLKNGTYPANLKLSFIIPIYKSGARTEVTNYRLIAIQPVFAKLFESLVLDKLAFDLKHTIVNEQHVFHSGMSTATNLILL
ncbi:uncharacterized protein LOC124369461 [Homalodisca vitripennis]|uniref:uncharacterized protein LOC124369461 n=1 Tax=Homalodisca vitripennis TaxID=197043 RepID=UPI001EEBA194|nr:uncharacterized protein LOC124369461 [Homalodisca vitripennis]